MDSTNAGQKIAEKPKITQFFCPEGAKMFENRKKVKNEL